MAPETVPASASTEELLKKYRLAGRIRLISFSLLLAFLLAMKCMGGYPCVDASLLLVVFFEAVLNQPYRGIVRRVDLRRFQYFQMAADIVAISWMMHCMGGSEASVMTFGYYAVILWAGAVSTVPAVFFAAGFSAACFSAVVLLEYAGIVPPVSYYPRGMPFSEALTVLAGNISFFFAFGYFSSRAAFTIRSLERKRYEDSLEYAHRSRATGYLVGYIAHDAVNRLASIIGYAQLLLNKKNALPDDEDMVHSIKKLGQKSADILSRLAVFSQEPGIVAGPVSVNAVITDAVELTRPLVRCTRVATETKLDAADPLVWGERGRLHEMFVALILNALKAMPDQGALTVTTALSADGTAVEAAVSDTGSGMTPEDIRRARDGELFFAARAAAAQKAIGPASDSPPRGADSPGIGMGLATAREIVVKHGGVMEIRSGAGKGTTVTMRFPAFLKENAG